MDLIVPMITAITERAALLVENLEVRLVRRDTVVEAVNGVSFQVSRGQTLGILGESGCGKSVTLRALLRLLPAKYAKISGRIVLDDHDILAATDTELIRIRGKSAAMIFQEPMASFDPVFTIGRQITEMIRHHDSIDEVTARKRAIEMLERVQIPSAARRFDNYPHEMSGGMLQRSMIALALSCRPTVLLADEPTTALDATVQIQILLLLRELQREFNMAVIFVTHDVGAATEVADHLAVMYAGQFVESGPVREVIRQPLHPYTKGLLASINQQGKGRGRLEAIPGTPPNLAKLPPGCAFAPRCCYAESVCHVGSIVLSDVGPEHTVRCVRAMKLPQNVGI